MLTEEDRRMFSEALIYEMPGTTTAEHRRLNGTEQDGTGAPVDRWQTVGTFVGRLRTARGQREVFQGEQVHAAVDMEWVMPPYDLAADPLPADKRLKAKDQLRVNGRVFDVIGDDGGRSGALLLVVQLTAVE